MKNIKKMILALAALTLAACATSDMKEDGMADADRPQLKLAAIPVGKATTRAEVEIQTAVFDADELLQAYIWHDEDVEAHGQTAQNYFEPLLTAMEPENNVNPLYADRYLLGPADPAHHVSLYALYPSWVKKDATTFTVSADQTEDGDAEIQASDEPANETARGYKGSDLMFGSRTSVPASESPVLITFSHKMAKIVVNAKNDGTVAGLIIQSIKLKGFKRTIGFNATTGVLGDAGTLADASDIAMSNYGAALLPPKQTVAADADFIEVTTNKGTAMFKLGTDLLLQEGHQYTFNLDIGMQAMTVRATTITDWSDDGTSDTVAPLGEGEFAIRSIPDDDGRVYDNTAHEPDFVILTAEGSYESTTAAYTENFDAPQYFGNVNAGQGIVVVKGKDGGAYEGKVGTQTFVIKPRDINAVTASVTGDYTYTGALQTATVEASDNFGGDDIPLNATDHYDLSGYQQTDANETGYDLVLTGKGNYTGTKTIPFVINKKEITADDLSFQSMEYLTDKALIFTKSQLSDSTKPVVVNFKGGTLTAESSTLDSKVTYQYADCTSSADDDKQGTITVKRSSDKAFYAPVTVKLTPDDNHKTADGNPLTMTFHLAAATTLTTANAEVGNVVARDASVFSSANNSMEIPSAVFSHYNTTNVGVITASGYVVMLWNNQGNANSDGQNASYADSDKECNSANGTYGVTGKTWKTGTKDEYTACITNLWSTVNTTIVNAGGRSLGGENIIVHLCKE